MPPTSDRQDPRTIITPDAFSVAPELLGLQLASPWRRAAAIAVDLLLVAILANASAVFFAFAAGLFVLWLAVAPRGGRVSTGARRVARTALGCLGALVLTTAALAIWFGVVVGRFGAGDPSSDAAPTAAAVADLVRMAATGDSAAIEAAAQRLVERLEPDAQESPATDPDELSLEQLIEDYRAASQAEDSATIALVGPVLGERLAADRIEELTAEVERSDRQVDDLREDLDEVESELEDERNRGLLASVVGLLDDVGLGLGWSGLYFTFFLGWWKGRTPGKRLLGTRVVRLDGRPLGYWVSFERYGGYAASLFTGLEGFARLIWDPNRQALEDKLAGTVVIRDLAESKKRVSGLHARSGGAPTPGERLWQFRNAGG